MYLACSDEVSCSTDLARVEQEYARGTRRIPAELAEADYRLKDGEATVLEAGTPLYPAVGRSPAIRLQADLDGDLRVYAAKP